MTSQSLITPRTEVVACELETGQVLLDLSSGNYFVLNSTGHYVWSLIEQSKTFEDIQKSMADRYDVEEPALIKELEALLIELSDKGLVAIS